MLESQHQPDVDHDGDGEYNSGDRQACERQTDDSRCEEEDFDAEPQRVFQPDPCLRSDEGPPHQAANEGAMRARGMKAVNPQ